VSLPVFHSALETPRIRRLAFSWLSVSLSATAKRLSSFYVATLSIWVSGSAFRRLMMNLQLELCGLAALFIYRFVSRAGQSRQ
jgi:hypothetical protein